MDIYFTTVVRGACVNDGGEFVHLNWDEKRCTKCIKIYPRNPHVNDPHTRGNSRGGRGIEIIDSEIFVASYHSIEVFNKKLELERIITNNSFAGIHELVKGNDSIWVASTSAGAALEVDPITGNSKKEYWPGEEEVFQKRLKLKPVKVDKTKDNRLNFLKINNKKGSSHLHLNTVTPWKDNLYALFNNQGIIVNLKKKEIIIIDKLLQGAHNLIITDDGTAFVNSSRNNKILVVDLKTGEKKDVIDMLQFEYTRAVLKKYKASLVTRILRRLRIKKKAIARPLFWRGMDIYKNYLFVGSSPASIYCIDYMKKEIVDIFSYSDDVNVTIHGIKVKI